MNRPSKLVDPALDAEPIPATQGDAPEPATGANAATQDSPSDGNSTEAAPAPARPHTRPRPHRKDSSHLVRCRDTADMAFQLIAHLAGRGVLVERSDYEAIHAIAQIGDREVTAEMEHAFWESYTRIVDLLDEDEDPEGIYYTAMFENPKGKAASETTRFHRRWLSIYSLGIAVIALFVLFMLVLLLAYGTAVNNILRSVQALEAESFSIQAENYSATRLRGISAESCAYSNETYNQETACEAALADIEGELTTTYRLLHDFVFVGLMAKDDKFNTHRIRTIAQQLFIFLSDLIYPLLAGALGACVSLLRVIFQELREKRLHLRVFKSAYLRIAVGTIAGIVIGWVVSVETPSGISLTPLALAFVAGYAVEVIYNLLDRLVTAFSTANDDKGNTMGRHPAPRNAPMPVCRPGGRCYQERQESREQAGRPAEA